MASTKGSKARSRWILGVLFCLSGSVWAQDEAKLRAVYKEGVRCAEKKDWTCASEKFREALTLKETPNTYIALGSTELEQEHFLEAHRLYRKALSLAENTQNEEAASNAKRMLARVVSEIPKLRLSLPPGQKALRVTRNGKPLKRSGNLYFLDPGKYKIVVEPEGTNLHPYEVEVAPQTRGLIELKVTFESVSGPAPSSSPKPPTPQPSSGPPVGALVLGGVGVILAGWGAYTWQNANSKYEQLVDRAKQCNFPCPEQEKTLISSGYEEQSSRIVRGQVVLGVGLGSVALGALWWGLSSPGKSSSSSIGLTFSPLLGGGYTQLHQSF